jgi:hypothetical protein
MEAPMPCKLVPELEWHEVPVVVRDLCRYGREGLVKPAQVGRATPSDLAESIAAAALAAPAPGGFELPETFDLAPKRAATDAAEDAGLYLPTIPVDAFNQVVWSDVRPNPFGTRGAFGDNSQPLATPPNVAALVSGILEGTSATTGRGHVSPLEVALTAGGMAGRGWLGGLVLGKTLGVLAGMPPERQQQLQQAGLWGGMISGAVQSLFGS